MIDQTTMKGKTSSFTYTRIVDILYIQYTYKLKELQSLLERIHKHISTTRTIYVLSHKEAVCERSTK